MPIFPNCKDPTLVALKSFGYNVVQLPRPDLLPTQLLVSRNGRLQRLGDLTSVFVPGPNGAAIPPIKPEQPGPDISGTRSNAIEVGIGLDILGGLISALGGSTLGVDIAYSKASSVQFSYSGTTRVDTDLALVDQFLASASINGFARATRQMLDADSVYLVTSVIKSDSITVAAKDASKKTFEVKVPVIQEAIGGNLDVKGNAESASLVTYKGKIPLAFGFQAVRLIYEDGSYRAMKLVKAGSVSAEGVVSAEGTKPVMLSDEAMLRGDL